jgi:hypothetical protein
MKELKGDICQVTQVMFDVLKTREFLAELNEKMVLFCTFPTSLHNLHHSSGPMFFLALRPPFPPSITPRLMVIGTHHISASILLPHI